MILCSAKTTSRAEPASAEMPAYSGPFRLISGRERRSKMTFIPLQDVSGEWYFVSAGGAGLF
jgi:hypothetical protein